MFYPHTSSVVNNLNQDILINNEHVNYVQSYLYLGIDIDQHLTFKTYFNTMFQSVSHKLYFFKESSSFAEYQGSLRYC